MDSFFFIREDFRPRCERLVRGTRLLYKPPLEPQRFSEAFWQLRCRLGLSRAEFAAKLEISIKTLVLIETAKSTLDDQQLEELLENAKTFLGSLAMLKRRSTVH